jgi:cytochrome P450
MHRNEQGKVNVDSGDLTLADSFGCLKTSGYHSWVALLFAGLKAGSFMAAARQYPACAKLLNLLIPRRLMQKREEHRAYSFAKTAQRLDEGVTERADFISYMLREGDVKSMSREEIIEISKLLLFAGSETTATLLSGLTYLICTHKDVYNRVVKEIRSTYRTESEISFTSMNHTPFVQACIEEALRLFPPTPLMPYRVIRSGGDTVCGHYLVGGVRFPLPFAI